MGEKCLILKFTTEGEMKNAYNVFWNEEKKKSQRELWDYEMCDKVQYINTHNQKKLHKHVQSVL